MTYTYELVNERLPFELGWSPSDEVISEVQILAVSNLIAAATNLFTGEGEQPHVAPRRRDLHSGMAAQNP